MERRSFTCLSRSGGNTSVLATLRRRQHRSSPVLSDQKHCHFYDRLRLVEYHQFPRISQAAVSNYFNLIDVSLTTPFVGSPDRSDHAVGWYGTRTKTTGVAEPRSAIWTNNGIGSTHVQINMRVVVGRRYTYAFEWHCQSKTA
jgi:hypothetical protein